MTTDTITSDSVASVSLKDAYTNPQAFAEEIGNSFVDYGFAIVRDHGIPQDLIDDAEEKAKQFFALPEAVKQSYKIEGSGGARGYTPFGIETAKGATAHDLKEFWHVGRDLPEGHPFRAHMGDNVWPAEVPGFPVLIKPDTGLGGVGLRVVRDAATLTEVYMKAMAA